MKVSIVIPVYNEAERLSACLRAIAAQKTSPHEVIVVDNNSTDASARIALSFDFVQLIKEPRQGVVHARNRGFNAAKGDIIGRIDADTLLPADWTAKLQQTFSDPSVTAVSGSAHYYDFAWDKAADSIDLQLRRQVSRKLGNQQFLWGANMAVRRSAWQQVRRGLCSANGIHEDFDLAIHLQDKGQKVIYDERLTAAVSCRRIDMSFADYIRYSLVSPRTYARHGLKSQRHMYPAMLVCWACYLPGRLIYRAFDGNGNFSVSQLLSANPARPDPTTNIL